MPDIDALQQANARELAKRHDLPLPPTLDELDAVLAKVEEYAEVGEDEESDEAFDAELVVLAGAYAGRRSARRPAGAGRTTPKRSS